MYLIDKGADICGYDSQQQQQTVQNVYSDFERSPLQDAIRLNRTKIVEKMLQSMFERDDMRTIEWVFAKRYDILRQVLMTENLDTIKVILPNIIENR
jgi:superfamily II helicase